MGCHEHQWYSNSGCGGCKAEKRMLQLLEALRETSTLLWPHALIDQAIKEEWWKHRAIVERS